MYAVLSAALPHTHAVAGWGMLPEWAQGSLTVLHGNKHALMVQLNTDHDLCALHALWLAQHRQNVWVATARRATMLHNE